MAVPQDVIQKIENGYKKLQVKFLIYYFLELFFFHL